MSYMHTVVTIWRETVQWGGRRGQNRTSPAPQDEARNGHPLRNTWNRPFSRKTKTALCACVIHWKSGTPAHIIWPLFIHSFIPLFRTLATTASKYFTPCELNGSINDLKPEVHPHNICTLSFYFTPNTWIPKTNTIWLMLFKAVIVFDSVYKK